MEYSFYLIVLFSLYFFGCIFSLLEKISAYKLAVRYEEVSRSRETLREMKELKAKIRNELPLSFLWPVEIFHFLKIFKK